MSQTASDLLKALAGSGDALRVRPPAVQPPPSAEELTRTGSFAELLSRVRSGGLSSAEPVTISPGAGVELSADQLQRLSVAADMAQAAGASRVMVRIDGQSLTLDVATRQIIGKAQVAPGQVVTGIDAVLDVPPAPGSPTVQTEAPPAALAGTLPRKSVGVSPSVLAALSAGA